jgi:hypothetical protein
LITGSDAALLARSWAEQASRAEGALWTEAVEEFDLGYVVWVQPPPGTRSSPGAQPRRVIDRETGEITIWGSIPHQLVVERYREHRQAFPVAPTTVDPVATIRRLAARPTVVDTVVHARFAHDRRVRTSRGAKGDQTLNHHPAVRAWLDAQPAGTICRGAERHSEIVLISDVLHGYDAGTGRVTTLDQARGFLRLMELQHTQVSPLASAGEPALPCHTCQTFWAYLGLVPPPGPARTPTMVVAPDRPDFPDPLRPFVVGRMLAGPLGTAPRHPLPASLATIGDKYLAAIQLSYGVGGVHRAAPFSIDGLLMVDTLHVLDDLSALIGVTAYRIGSDGESGGLIAADEHGRVFAIDQAGEWFLGADIDAALVTLCYGLDQPRVRDDGTW